MNNFLANTARPAGAGLRALLVLTVLCGVLYPLAVTGVAQAFFPDKADGSQLGSGGEVVGSELLGQRYDLPLKNGQDAPEPDLTWFQPRPSDGLGTNTANTQYDLLVSGATNRSGDNPELVRRVKEAKAAVAEDNSTADFTVRPSEVPSDAVTSSASGLDPHISPQYARLQIHRVAERNKLRVAQVRKLVDDHTEGRILGFLGEPHVNVLKLNVALRELTGG